MRTCDLKLKFPKLGGGTSHIKGQIEKIRFKFEISKTWAICMKAVPVRSRVTYLAKLGGLRRSGGEERRWEIEEAIK